LSTIKCVNNNIYTHCTTIDTDECFILTHLKKDKKKKLAHEGQLYKTTNYKNKTIKNNSTFVTKFGNNNNVNVYCYTRNANHINI